MTNGSSHICHFVWKIENFSIGPKQNRDFIVSPIFTSKLLDETGWCIILMLEECDDNGFLRVCLRRIMPDKGPFLIDGGFEISVVDNNGVQRQIQRIPGKFLKGTILSHNRFVEKKEVSGENSQLLLNDTLTLKGHIWKNSSVDVPAEKVMIRSKLGMTEAYFQIKVNPIQYSVSYLITSDTVRDGVMLTCKWECLERLPPHYFLFPSIIIKPQSETTSSIFVSAKITIRQRDESHFRTKDVNRFEAGSTSAWTMSGLYQRLRTHYRFDDMGDMDLMCEVNISHGAKEDIYDYKHTEMFENFRVALNRKPRNDLVNDVKRFITNIRFPDMHIEVGENRFGTHRFILCARSPLLRKLLLEVDAKWESSSKNSKKVLSVMSCSGKRAEVHVHSGDEKAINQILHRVKVSKTKDSIVAVFPDVGITIMKKILSFMYTDSPGYVDFDTAVKLLQASDLYQIDGLKAWCESFLMTRITSVPQGWQALLVACSLHCHDLKKAARLYLYENRECFMRYTQWQVFENDDDKDFTKFFTKICDLSDNV